VILSRLPDDTSNFSEKAGWIDSNREMINTSEQTSTINFFVGMKIL
jgi:hypothetical protein